MNSPSFRLPNSDAAEALAESVEANRKMDELINHVKALTDVGRANNKQLELLTEVELTEGDV